MPASRTSRFDMGPRDAERFTKRLVATDTSCIRWGGASRVIKGFTYGILTWRGQQKTARTFAWILAGKGDTPRGGIELGCGNPWCVNGEHMRPLLGDRPGRFKPGNSGYKGKGPHQRTIAHASLTPTPASPHPDVSP